jgi:retinol dehydrogenase-12
MEDVKLDGKTVLVTGANSGIGKETARDLARRGARVIMGCRNRERGEEARRDIIASTKNEHVHVKILDLSSLQSVEQFADEFNNSEAHLHLLVNNAGLWVTQRQLTMDGFEMEIGTNHLGHFYLTYLLLDKLKSSTPSRVVNVSSNLHARGKLKLNDLQFEHGWGAMEAYARSKTANILFTVHLAKILAGTGVTTYALHPGVIKTELARNYGSCLESMYACCFGCCLKTPVQGAATTLYCCLEPTIADHTGRYYSGCHETTASSHATDAELAEKLWAVSCQLCKIEH